MLCVGSKRQRLGPGAGGTGQGATGLDGVPAALLELTGLRGLAPGDLPGPGSFLGDDLAAAGSAQCQVGRAGRGRWPGNGRPAQGLDQPFPAYLRSEHGRDEPDPPEARSSGLRRAARTRLFPGCGDKDELLVELIPPAAPSASVSLPERRGRESGHCFGAVMETSPRDLGTWTWSELRMMLGVCPGGGDRMSGNFEAREKPHAPRLGCEVERRGWQRVGPAGGPESRAFRRESGSLSSAACPPPPDGTDLPVAGPGSPLHSRLPGILPPKSDRGVQKTSV